MAASVTDITDVLEGANCTIDIFAVQNNPNSLRIVEHNEKTKETEEKEEEETRMQG